MKALELVSSYIKHSLEAGQLYLDRSKKKVVQKTAMISQEPAILKMFHVEGRKQNRISWVREIIEDRSCGYFIRKRPCDTAKAIELFWKRCKRQLHEKVIWRYPKVSFKVSSVTKDVFMSVSVKLSTKILKRQKRLLKEIDRQIMTTTNFFLWTCWLQKKMMSLLQKSLRKSLKKNYQAC